MADSSEPAKEPIAPNPGSEKDAGEAQEALDTAHSEDQPTISSPPLADDSAPATPQPDPTAASKQDSAPAEQEENTSDSEPDEEKEDGEIGPNDAPLLPAEPEPQPATAPLPADDGWDALFSEEANGWYFYNRFTHATTWENPRVTQPSTAAPSQPQLPTEQPAAGGYNPAIHGDYDPTAWYAQTAQPEEEDTAPIPSADGGDLVYVSGGYFNRASGKFQMDAEDGSGVGAERYSDEAKSQRQMGAFFDVDAAANSHDGRSLKAERSGKKPSKSELKAFKEKRRAKKEEKRRAWLRD